MQVKLNYIEIENFKKIMKLKLDFGGESVIIKGRNETGKTTVADALYWLITGANSDFQSNFSPIRLGENGEEIDNLDACVEAQFSVGSKALTLRREFKQNWKKKKGALKSEFTGHYTEYFVDGVPKNKRDFDDVVKEIVKPEMYRILSDVHHFAARLNFKKRRKYLMPLAGDIKDDELVKTFPDLAEVPKILDGQDIDDVRAMLNRQWKKLNELIDDLPKLINENKSQRPDISDIDVDNIDSLIAEKQAAIDAMDRLVNDLKNGNIDIAAQNELNQTKADLQQLEFELQRKMVELRENFVAAIYRSEKTISSLNEQLQSIGHDNRRNEDEIKFLERRLEILKKDWRKIHLQEYQKSERCYACNQKLPHEHHELMEEKFKAEQAEKIKEVDAKGKRVVLDIKSFKEVIQKNEDNAKKIGKKIILEKETIIALHNKSDATSNELEESYKPKFNALNYKINELKMRVEGGADQIENENYKIIERDRAAAVAEKTKFEDQKLKVRDYNQRSERIKKQEENLHQSAIEFEEIERKRWLIDEWERRWAELVEKSVNQYFEITQWKLFEIQMNEGLKNICEPTYKGIPYTTNLNTGAKINIGLDIICALSRHHGIKLPVIIDNAESITDWLIEPGQQVIKLVADENCSELELQHA